MKIDVKVTYPKIFKELDKPHRYKIMHGGRGSSKSWTVAQKLLIKGMEEPLRILCTRELQKSIKQSVHKLLSIQINRLGLQKFYDVTGDVIRGVNGTEFIFMGVKHNAEEIKSTESINVCWIEEAHNLSDASWDIIDPTIRMPGSEIWVTYNPRFKFDCVHKKFVIDKPPPDSWVQEVNHEDNPFFPDVLRVQMEHMERVDFEKYLHVWEGQLRILAQGAIFGKQIALAREQSRICKLPVPANKEVFAFFDIGKNDATSIWFMYQDGREYHFFDYYENRLQDVDFYIRRIKKMGYNIGRYYLPHDAAHKRIGMVRTVEQQFNDGGIRPTTIVPCIATKNTAIELAREKMPLCLFHQDDDDTRNVKRVTGAEEGMETRGLRMDRGMDALANYRYKFKDEDKTFQLVPHHDWASNGADAFMQFAQGFKSNRGAFSTKGWKSSGGMR